MTEVIRNKQLAKILSVASDGHYHQYELLDFLELFPRVIEGLILEGNEVRWTNFGSFRPKYSNSKVIKSKLHGASYEIPPGMTMKFTVSETFQRDLKGKFMKVNSEVMNAEKEKQNE